MNPTFIDIHIHTSENPEELNRNYDVEREMGSDLHI